MPMMMITPVSQVLHYSLPLTGFGHGTYTVSWRATVQDEEERGSFRFAVR